ncbi:hypothetical protein FQA47_008566 [Oryzias melastigma]|uniref:Ig-like domain-containing protein n=1 Tax=Oryzias melastigma TaxID=30732 RepID=A0A834L0P5_ORYME|nr:hypothetical protein FQA47_008566 [Oryzias melastigma]
MLHSGVTEKRKRFRWSSSGVWTHSLLDNTVTLGMLGDSVTFLSRCPARFSNAPLLERVWKRKQDGGPRRGPPCQLLVHKAPTAPTSTTQRSSDEIQNLNGSAASGEILELRVNHDRGYLSTSTAEEPADHLLVLPSPPLNSSLLDFMLSWWAVAAVLCLPCGLSYHALRILRIGERGQSLVLPCDGSAFRDQEGMVRWEQVEETVVLLRGGETSVAESLRGRVQLPSEEQIKEGNWSLVINSITPSDEDVYLCIFNTSTLVSSVWVRVLENEATVADPSMKPLRIIDGSGGGTTDLPFSTEVSTLTMTEDPKSTTDPPLLENFPWVRVGLIGGVLLVTSLVMGLLGALRQI